MASKGLRKVISNVPVKAAISHSERATRYIEEASRVQIHDLKDNPGARTGVSHFNFYRINVDLLGKTGYCGTS
jgi:hypothetical protein